MTTVPFASSSCDRVCRLVAIYQRPVYLLPVRFILLRTKPGPESKIKQESARLLASVQWWLVLKAEYESRVVHLPRVVWINQNRELFRIGHSVCTLKHRLGLALGFQFIFHWWQPLVQFMNIRQRLGKAHMHQSLSCREELKKNTFWQKQIDNDMTWYHVAEEEDSEWKRAEPAASTECYH